MGTTEKAPAPRRRHVLGFEVDACSFQPEQWDEWPGIDGMVMLCNTHGHPGIGVYHFELDKAVGTCNAVEYPPSLMAAADTSTPNRITAVDVVATAQWGSSEDPRSGIPSIITRLLASPDGKTRGYGHGDGWSTVFGTEHGDLPVQPGQWVNKHADGTFSATDNRPTLTTEMTMSSTTTTTGPRLWVDEHAVIGAAPANTPRDVAVELLSEEHRETWTTFYEALDSDETVTFDRERRIADGEGDVRPGELVRVITDRFEVYDIPVDIWTDDRSESGAFLEPHKVPAAFDDPARPGHVRVAWMQA